MLIITSKTIFASGRISAKRVNPFNNLGLRIIKMAHGGGLANEHGPSIHIQRWGPKRSITLGHWPFGHTSTSRCTTGYRENAAKEGRTEKRSVIRDSEHER